MTDTQNHTSQPKGPVMLCILDGWGYRAERENNAFALANTPNLDRLLATFVATLGLGIEEGILVGVVLSLAVVIYRTTKPHIASMGQVPGTRGL